MIKNAAFVSTLVERGILIPKYPDNPNLKSLYRVANTSFTIDVALKENGIYLDYSNGYSKHFFIDNLPKYPKNLKKQANVELVKAIVTNLI